MESLFALMGLYVMLELFEIFWQKAESLMGIMLKLYERYAKSILLFLLMHPTYYFGIWLVMVTDYAFAAVLLLLLKTMDIAVKILMIQQIFEKRELSQEMSMMLLAPLHPLLPYLSLIVYAPLVFISLT